MQEKISSMPVMKCVFALFFDKITGRVCPSCIRRIFYNFFYRQYKANLLKNIPVKNVDHSLDEKIPFLPKKVDIYLDFIAFWIRTAGFLLKMGLKTDAADFIDSIGRLYAFAAEVYSKHTSTTRRPRYLRTFRFVLIHAFDPHLMCIPSLHVMVVAFAYKKFAVCAPAQSSQIEELKNGSLAITESVLYVKQHSVNCIAAALYALTRFDGALFSPQDAENFTACLFTDGTITQHDAALIRAHIINLYKEFLSNGENCPWEKPLLDFLRKM